MSCLQTAALSYKHMSSSSLVRSRLNFTRLVQLIEAVLYISLHVRGVNASLMLQAPTLFVSLQVQKLLVFTTYTTWY